MPDKAFMPKRERPVHAVTIDEHGNLTYLATDANDIFLELGDVVTKRASHVEPAGFLLRVAFHILRAFGDKTRVADWTREWTCLWRVNCSPVGGTVLRVRDVPKYIGHPDEIAVWHNRQAAIAAEVEFLNDYFLERGN